MLQIEADEYNEAQAIRDDELGGLPANIGADVDEGAGTGGWNHFWQRNRQRMNPKQTHAFNSIKRALESHRAKEDWPKLFFLEGAGGTGTYT